MDARKAKSRAAIVAAFSELLREEDYGKITVGDIIARAHVGRATFYGLFKSKDDLLAELVRDICTHALDDDGTPLDDPLVQVEHILNNLWERRQGVRALVAGAGSRVFADCLRKTIMSRAAETVPVDPARPRRHHGPKLPTTPHSLKLRRNGPMVGLAQLPSPKRGRSQRLPLSHKTPLQLSKNLIPKHRPNPRRHASQSIRLTASTPLPATSPSHPNSDIYVELLVRTQPRMPQLARVGVNFPTHSAGRKKARRTKCAASLFACPRTRWEVTPCGQRTTM